MALGEDLLLSSLDPTDGRIRRLERIGFLLRASELVDLALAGRITVADGRIEIADRAPTGNERLDQALDSIAEAPEPPAVAAWLGQRAPRAQIFSKYRTALADQGAIRVEHRDMKNHAVQRIIVLDEQRRRQALDRLDRVADGSEASAEDLALASLVHACRLGRDLYPGWRGRAQRKRLARRATQQEFTEGARTAEVAAAANASRVAATASDMTGGSGGGGFVNSYPYDGSTPGHHHGGGHDHGGHFGGHDSGGHDFGGGGDFGGGDGGGW